VRKPEGKRLFGRSRRRWNNISVNIREIGQEAVHWIDLTVDREKWPTVVNKVMKLSVP
jgi:hypothetical protein